MQNRKEKTSSEYQNLKSETSDETSKTITPATYDKIHDTAISILQRFEKKEFKNAPTLALLLEIETRIERADAYILQHMATEMKILTEEIVNVKKDVKAVNQNQEVLLQKKRQEEANKAQLNKAKERVVLTGVRKMMPVSQKQAVEKKKKQTNTLTQEQMDMKKYVGESLFQAFLEDEKKKKA